jgi:hypothetical protein
MFKKSILCVVAISAMFFTACMPAAVSKSTIGTPIEKSKVDLIVKNETTESEILEMFGEPMNKAMVGDAVQWMYYYQDMSAETTVKAFQGGEVTAKGRQQKLDVQIKDGVVTNFVHSDGPMPTIQGAGGWK